MILHIPHSSRKIDNFINLEHEKENLDFLTDDRTDELFGCDPFQLIFPYSRFICDVERFRKNDPMEKIGQGVIYRKDIFGNNIERYISDKEVYKMYDEHHKKFTIKANFGLGLFSKIVIVDCHSFTPCNKYQSEIDICIGTDPFHTPDILSKFAKKYFIANGLSVSVNFPFSGCIVPYIHYRKNKDIISIMIEVNKKIYRYDAGFEKTKLILQELLEIISKWEVDENFG
jgi:N-formylglutamate amidohydrolase